MQGSGAIEDNQLRRPDLRFNCSPIAVPDQPPNPRRRSHRGSSGPPEACQNSLADDPGRSLIAMFRQPDGRNHGCGRSDMRSDGDRGDRMRGWSGWLGITSDVHTQHRGGVRLDRRYDRSQQRGDVMKPMFREAARVSQYGMTQSFCGSSRRSAVVSMG
jgi:hypothetical protein